MIEHYSHVVRIGEVLRYQDRAAALGRWFKVFASRVGDAGSLRVAILFSDIAARKHAEEALRASEARFRTRRCACCLSPGDPGAFTSSSPIGTQMEGFAVTCPSAPDT
jgi:hypothetical protein